MLSLLTCTVEIDIETKTVTTLPVGNVDVVDDTAIHETFWVVVGRELGIDYLRLAVLQDMLRSVNEP